MIDSVPSVGLVYNSFERQWKEIPSDEREREREDEEKDEKKKKRLIFF